MARVVRIEQTPRRYPVTTTATPPVVLHHHGQGSRQWPPVRHPFVCLRGFWDYQLILSVRKFITKQLYAPPDVNRVTVILHVVFLVEPFVPLCYTVL